MEWLNSEPTVIPTWPGSTVGPYASLSNCLYLSVWVCRGIAYFISFIFRGAVHKFRCIVTVSERVGSMSRSSCFFWNVALHYALHLKTYKDISKVRKMVIVIQIANKMDTEHAEKP